MPHLLPLPELEPRCDTRTYRTNLAAKVLCVSLVVMVLVVPVGFGIGAIVAGLRHQTTDFAPVIAMLVFVVSAATLCCINVFAARLTVSSELVRFENLFERRSILRDRVLAWRRYVPQGQDPRSSKIILISTDGATFAIPEIFDFDEPMRAWLATLEDRDHSERQRTKAAASERHARIPAQPGEDSKDRFHPAT